MEFNEGVLTIIAEAAAKFPMDISKGAKWAEERIRKLEDFDEIVDELLRKGILELIYDHRHASNVATKRQAKYYDKEQKVETMGSEAVGRAISEYKSCYDYCIAGKVLGMLKGEEIPDLMNREKELSNGHLFNFRLLGWLNTVVKPKQMVKDAVSETRLRATFAKLSKGQRGMAG